LDLNVPDEGYYRDVPDEGYYRNVPDEGFYRNVPDEGYYRDASYTLNLTCTLLFLLTMNRHHYYIFSISF
jgi:hypothetical protein